MAAWGFRHMKQLGEGGPDLYYLLGRLVIYYSQSITITITFENIQSITITSTFENFKSITITLASITSITFCYILLQFGAKLRGNFNTEIKLAGYSIYIFIENASDYAIQG